MNIGEWNYWVVAIVLFVAVVVMSVAQFLLEKELDKEKRLKK